MEDITALGRKKVSRVLTSSDNGLPSLPVTLLLLSDLQKVRKGIPTPQKLITASFETAPPILPIPLPKRLIRRHSLPQDLQRLQPGTRSMARPL